MGVTNVNNGLNQEKGINYTVITDTSADWGSVSNDVYFYDKDTNLPYYKNTSGNVVSLFEEGGSGGQLPSLNDGEIFVGDVTNNAQSVTMSGDVNIDNSGVSTIQPDSVTYDKMQDTTQAALLGNQSGAGTVGEIPIVEQYLNTGSTTALLEDISNWDVNGNYTGTTITGTFQGQSYYNNNYYFVAVDDNVWIRLIRG